MGEVNKFTKEGLLKSILEGGSISGWIDNRVNPKPELDSKGLYITTKGLKFLEDITSKGDPSNAEIAFISVLLPAAEFGVTKSKVVEANKLMGLSEDDSLSLINMLEKKGFLE